MSLPLCFSLKTTTYWITRNHTIHSFRTWNCCFRRTQKKKQTKPNPLNLFEVKNFNLPKWFLRFEIKNRLKFRDAQFEHNCVNIGGMLQRNCFSDVNFWMYTRIATKIKSNESQCSFWFGFCEEVFRYAWHFIHLYSLCMVLRLCGSLFTWHIVQYQFKFDGVHTYFHSGVHCTTYNNTDTNGKKAFAVCNLHTIWLCDCH